MDNSQFVVKRIVSPDGKVIAEMKSFAQASGDGSKISQSVRIKVSSEENVQISSQSGSISISCNQRD